METYEYVPKSERKKASGKAVLILRELTIRDVVALEDELVEPDAKGRLVAKVGTGKLKKFLMAVTGWRDVMVKGQPLAFTEENKLALPVSWYQEVVDAINQHTELGEVLEGD